MNIQEIQENIKQFLVGKDTMLVAILLGVGIGSFLLGRASVAPVPNIHTTEHSSFSAEAIQSTEVPRKTEIQAVSSGGGAEITSEGGYVASKNGTKYHLPWCSGAKRIKEENKVWFRTKEEAEDAGYTPAANCKGI